MPEHSSSLHLCSAQWISWVLLFRNTSLSPLKPIFAAIYTCSDTAPEIKAPSLVSGLNRPPLAARAPQLPCGSFTATRTADPHQSAPHQPSQLCCVNENQHHPRHLSAPAFSEALLVLFFFFVFFPDEGPELNTRLNKQATSAFIWCCKDLFISLPFLLIHNIHLFFF